MVAVRLHLLDIQKEVWEEISGRDTYNNKYNNMYNNKYNNRISDGGQIH